MMHGRKNIKLQKYSLLNYTNPRVCVMYCVYLLIINLGENCVF